MGSILWLVACSPETSLRSDRQVVDPTPYEGREIDIWGKPPEWANCFEGFRGLYMNLDRTHPHVEEDELSVRTEPLGLDWWDTKRLSQDRFDASIDFGENWWPIDDGLAGDPQYFAVRWVAWIRVWDDINLEFSLGAGNDGWVILDDDTILAAQAGQEDYEPGIFNAQLETGQYHFDVRYAHRADNTNGFRFRTLNVDSEDPQITICFPAYEDQSVGDD